MGQQTNDGPMIRLNKTNNQCLRNLERVKMDMNPIFAHMHANTFLLFSTWNRK